MINPDGDGLADKRFVTRQVDEFVAARPTGQVFLPINSRTVIVFVRALGSKRIDQNLHVAPQPGTIELGSDALLHPKQVIEATAFGRCRNVVSQVGRRRPGAGRVGGREDLVVPDRREQVEGLLVLRLRLAAEATMMSVEIVMPGIASRIRSRRSR